MREPRVRRPGLRPRKHHSNAFNIKEDDHNGQSDENVIFEDFFFAGDPLSTNEAFSVNLGLVPLKMNIWPKQKVVVLFYVPQKMAERKYFWWPKVARSVQERIWGKLIPRW